MQSSSKDKEELFSKMPTFTDENTPDIEDIIKNGGKAKNTLIRERLVLNTFKTFIENVEKLVIFFCYIFNFLDRLVLLNLSRIEIIMF